MRIGCVVVQNRPVTDLRADWRLLEDAGVDSLWIFDHIKPFRKMGVLLEAWSTLAAMAAATTRVRFGPLVTNITYREPAVLAKHAITIDHFSNGRFELGVGAGSLSDDDALVAGVTPWTLPERVARFEEYVDLVDALLSGRADRFEGRFYRTQSFARGPWPVAEPRLPLVVAAQGSRTLRVAARFADTWNGLIGKRMKQEPISFLNDCRLRLDDLASEFGRDPATIHRSVLLDDVTIPWWESAQALNDLVGRLDEAGIDETIFYHPPYGEAAAHIDASSQLTLLGELIAEPS